MAFDSKRLRTFKWLESICSKKKENLSKIFVYCGSLYATDEIILAKINYPEFEHVSDYEWSHVSKYADDDGKLLPAFETADCRQFTNDRIFDDMFIKELHRPEVGFDPKYMRLALKPFEINKIIPSIAFNEYKFELTGHNRDVSIRVLFMGTRF